MTKFKNWFAKWKGQGLPPEVSRTGEYVLCAYRTMKLNKGSEWTKENLRHYTEVFRLTWHNWRDRA